MIANTAAGVAHLCSWDYLTRPKKSSWATNYHRRAWTKHLQTMAGFDIRARIPDRGKHIQ